MNGGLRRSYQGCCCLRRDMMLCQLPGRGTGPLWSGRDAFRCCEQQVGESRERQVM